MSPFLLPLYWPVCLYCPVKLFGSIHLQSFESNLRWKKIKKTQLEFQTATSFLAVHCFLKMGNLLLCTYQDFYHSRLFFALSSDVFSFLARNWLKVPHLIFRIKVTGFRYHLFWFRGSIHFCFVIWLRYFFFTFRAIMGNWIKSFLLGKRTSLMPL